MGSSSKMAAPPAAAAPPPGVVPYGQTSPANIPWDNVLPNPATGDPIRPAQLSDPIWQSGNRMPVAPPPSTVAGPPEQDLRELLAALMSKGGLGGSGEFKADRFGSSRGGGGLGGNYGTSGGGQSSHSYGRTSSGTRSSAHAGGGKWGGK